MTVRASRLLLSGSITFLFLSACVPVDNRMGQDFIPTNQILSINTREFQAPMITCLADSMYMASPSYVGFGAIHSPWFGTTVVGGLVQYAPYSLEEDYGQDPVVQSLFMDIPMSEFMVFDQDERYIPQNVFVYKITKDLDNLEVYSSSFNESCYDPIPVSKSGTLFLGRDTLRIEFTDSFAYELLQADSSERDSSAAFTRRYKGLYFTTETMPGVENGGRINYMDLSSAYMYLKYKVGDADSLLTYYMNTTYGISYNTAKHQSEALISDQPSKYIYYEGLSGVKPCLDMPALIKEIEDWGLAQNPPVPRNRILISRAELVLPIEAPQNEDYTLADLAPASLYPCKKTVNDTLTYYTVLGDIYNDNPGGTLNRTKWEYSFEITSHLQAMLKQTEPCTQKDNLWIMSTIKSESSSSSSYYYYSYSSGTTTNYYVDNYSYKNVVLNGNLSSRPPYVRITYAVLLE